ncbi:MAG: beta strand repeat-containing protein, partial [Sediminibacterium sp.]
MAIQGFFTGDVKIRDLNGVLKAVNGIVEVATDAGTVTSVGLTVGSSGTDVNVANSPITTSGSITLNLPTASATNRGLLSSADWTTFNSKQGTITLTTTGSSGAATLIGTTLNIPNYGSALSGYVPYTGATGNVDLGEYGISSGYFQADLAPSGTLQVGRMQWNSTDGTMDLRLMGNNVTLQIGQEQVARVVNGTGGNLLEANYQAVKIIGAQGQRLQVGLARADNDANSKDTLGLVTETINNNQEGFITVSGLVNKINTTGSLQGETWADGDTLYLSGTTAGAITNVKPTAPIHTVIVGFVVYAHANNGKIYVKVDNGYELEELHDVAPTPYVNKGVLYRDTATNLWKSATIGTLLGYTPANAATTLTINGTAYDISANRTWNVGTVTSIGTSGPLTGGTITGSGTIGITQATTSTDGYLSSTDWNTFNSKQAALTFSAPLVNTSGTISIPAASASVNGYLSSTDWVTFNNKQAALNGTGFVKISGTTISYDNSTYYLASNPSAFIALTALSATAPLSYSNTTGVFSISQSTTSTDGYLSSTDWNTFNNKQAAGSYITALTGEATASGPGSASVTLSTSAVTGKLLTGLNLTGGGTIAATDSILQAFGKVQNQISGMVGGVTYQGTWNASTNTPTLTSSVGTKGYYYIVDVAGSTNLNGITDWKIGDWAIFNGSTWDKVDNTDAVSSVNGFTGAVSLTTSNISEGTNLYYLDSRARLALSFTAGSGAYDNTTGVITIPTNTSQLTNGANFITLSSLSASSPLAYNNGTGAFSIQVANGSQNGYLSSTDWTTFNSKQNTITLTTTGSSGSSTLVGATLNVPTYTLSGLGGVPTSRQLTINGTAYDLSADRSWSVGTVTGSGTTGYVSKWSSSTAISNSLLYDNGSAVLLGTATAGSGKFMVYSTTPDNHYQAVGSGPSFRFADTITSPTYTGIVALSTATNQFLTGSVAGDMVLANNTTSSIGNFLFGTGATERMRISPTGNVSINNTNNTYTFDVTGTVRFTGQLRLQSTITDGTNTYTLPSATGTLALTSQIPANPVGGTGTTNYLPKFTGTSTIGDSAIYDNSGNIGIGATGANTLLSLVGNHAGGQSILKIQS